MKQTITILLIALVALCTNCHKSNEERNMGNGLFVTSTAVDSQGNLYLAGRFTETVDLDPGKSLDKRSSKGGDSSAYITKLNSDGTYGWSMTFDFRPTTATEANLLIDSKDNVYFAWLEYYKESAGINAYVEKIHSLSIAKISSLGVTQWTKKITGNGYIRNLQLQKDSLEKIYICGNFNGAYDFNPNEGIDLHSSQEGSYQDSSSFISILTSDGSYVYTQSFDYKLTKMFIDKNDSIITTSSEGLIQKYDYDFNLQWKIQHANPYGGIGTIDASNNLVLYSMPHEEKSYDYDPGAGVDLITGGESSSFCITKFSPDGSYIKTNQQKFYLADTFRSISQVAIDAQNRIYVSGSLMKAVSFSTTTGIKNLPSSSYSTVFLARLTDDGLVDIAQSVMEYTDNSRLAIDNKNNLYVAGTFFKKIIFDREKTSDTDTTQGTGIFIVKYAEDGSYLWTRTLKGVSDYIEPAE